jgi:Zn ribbon nucleic-acid-binding protein
VNSHCAITDCSRTLPDGAHRRVCPRCASRIRARLAELHYQLPLLQASLQHDRSPTTGTIHGGRATSPMPLRADVINLLGPGSNSTVVDPYDETRGDQAGPLPIHTHLKGWAEMTADHVRLASVPGLRPGRTWADWLDAYLPWILTAAWVGEFHQELAELLARVRSITRTEPQRHLQDAPCPSCDAFGLIDEDWQPYVECTACGALLTHTEYLDHARRVLPQLYRTALHLVVEASKAQDHTPVS